MVFIPLYIFLIPYLLFALVFAVFIMVNIGHLVRTGSVTMVSFMATAIMMTLAVLIFYFTFSLLSGAYFGEPVVIWNGDWLKNIFTTTPTF